MYGFKIIFGAKMTGTCIPMSSPKDKTLDKNYEDKQLQTSNKHHTGMLTLLSPDIAPSPCHKEQTVVVMKKEN